eukprot:TRINITY_DN910_c0_g1_i2.p1 TRINITY_DN910_c0_g1~~TRINITY_DN910_c0_g1_i2.p1  ORF type:complete len:183 (+),score=41.26 TRINITY_DN910_c0_g1_i2:1-549(+)
MLRSLVGSEMGIRDRYQRRVRGTMGGPGTIDGKSVEEVDNFLECKFTVNGVTYPSSESYFQCQKCKDNKAQFDQLLKSGYGNDVRLAGNKVTLREDWEEVKVRVMYEGNKAKFEQNPNLKEALLKTKGSVTFHLSSPFWNAWNAKIIELIREELREPSERNVDKINEITGQMKAYEQENKKK